MSATTFRLRPWPPATSSGAEQPRILGDYRIVREVGRGGMGIVYEAEQRSLRRRVALKVMAGPRRLDSASRERFEREARSAARLHHTNIVPVFEVGQDGDICYYAMQFIEGIGLDRLVAHLDGRPSPETAALVGELASPGHPGHFRALARLAFQAAGGLSHAHVRGVIHRDIKPANLLMDAAGVLWITDFGLAKHSDDDLTRTGEMLGTLRYMPPEQFRNGCDARSDVYSLGITLYELATRRPAYPDPGGLGCPGAAPAEPRRPRSIDRRIPRDLETIILKAMERDPHRRYATAADLADDLRRFLDNEPIHARPIGPLGQVARWARRNPMPASLAAAVLVLAATMILGAVSAAVTFRRQAQAERELRQEADEAKVASQDTAAFMLGVLDENDPLDVFGADPRDRTERMEPLEVVERAVARLDASKQVAPKVRATLLDKFGAIYVSLGQGGRAESLLEEALRLRRAEQGEGSLEVAETLNNLGSLRLMQQALEPAERAYLQALEIREGALGTDAPPVTNTLVQLATVKAFGGRAAESASLLRRAIANHRKRGNVEGREYGLAVVLLTLVLFGDEQLTEANALLPETLRVLRKHEKNGPLPLAIRAHFEGQLARALGLNKQAAKRYAEAITLVEKSLGSSHFLVGLGRRHLGLHYLDCLRDLPSADRELRASIRLSDQIAGTRSVLSASARMHLGRVLRDQNRLAEAEALLREASGVMRAGRHKDSGRCLHILAEVCGRQGKRREGLAFLREAVGERRRVGDWLWYSHTASHLADELVHFGHVAEAAGELREAELQLGRLPSRTPDLSLALARVCAERVRLLVRLGGREAEVGEAAGVAADAVRAAAKDSDKPASDLTRDGAFDDLRAHPAFQALLSPKGS